MERRRSIHNFLKNNLTWANCRILFFSLKFINSRDEIKNTNFCRIYILLENLKGCTDLLVMSSNKPVVKPHKVKWQQLKILQKMTTNTTTLFQLRGK